MMILGGQRARSREITQFTGVPAPRGLRRAASALDRYLGQVQKAGDVRRRFDYTRVDRESFRLQDGEEAVRFFDRAAGGGWGRSDEFTEDGATLTTPDRGGITRLIAKWAKGSVKSDLEHMVADREHLRGRYQRASEAYVKAMIPLAEYFGLDEIKALAQPVGPVKYDDIVGNNYARAEDYLSRLTVFRDQLQHLLGR
jgi:hypothetical protein